MAKVSTLFALMLVLSLVLASEARSVPNEAKTQGDSVVENVTAMGVPEDGCDEGMTKEDCLTNKTMDAHLDYIYTQPRAPPAA